MDNQTIGQTIVFEDDNFLVLDKPFGLVVNRSATTNEITLQDQIAEYLSLAKDDLGIGDRAGIVHRLDRETSGLILVAKSQKYFDFLQEQFRQRLVKKQYIALVHNFVKEDRVVVKSEIGRVGRFGKFGEVKNGKEAETEFTVQGKYTLESEALDQLIIYGSTLDGRGLSSSWTKGRVNYLKRHAIEYTLLDVLPKTGRTHQIRVHLKAIAHPVVSDLIYDPAKLLKCDLLWCPRLFLHSFRIEFKKRSGVSGNVVFEAPLPYDLTKSLELLKKV